MCSNSTQSPSRPNFIMELTQLPSVTLTPKQRKFCLKYVSNCNASLAYREVYDCVGSNPSTVSRKTKELLDNGTITLTVNELFELHQQRHQVTVDSLSNLLGEDRDFARQNGYSAAVVSATMGKALLFPLIRDRSEITNLHTVMLDENSGTLAEQGRMIAAALAKCANQAEHDDRRELFSRKTYGD